MARACQAIFRFVDTRPSKVASWTIFFSVSMVSTGIILKVVIPSAYSVVNIISTQRVHFLMELFPCLILNNELLLNHGKDCFTSWSMYVFRDGLQNSPINIYKSLWLGHEAGLFASKPLQVNKYTLYNIE